MAERRLISLRDLLPKEEIPDSPGNKEVFHLTPLGILLYAQGKRMLSLGGYPSGVLFSEHLDRADDFDQAAIQEGRERIVTIDDYDTITVAQVNIGDIAVTTYPSIRKRATVNVNIAYTPSTVEDTLRERGKFTSNHDDFLKIFTGEQGGLVVFHGSDMPEDIGILFEKRIGEEKHGLLFFVRPDMEEDLHGLHSIDGFDALLGRLNEELITKLPLPLQRQALQALDGAIAAGEIRFASPQREQLLRTMVIAHAQLNAQNPHASHVEFLGTVTNRFDSFLGRRIDHKYKQERKQEKLNGAIDALMLPRPGVQKQAVKQEEVQTEAGKTEFPYNIDDLKSPQALLIRNSAKDYMGKSFLSGPMQAYFKGFLIFLEDAQTSVLLNDAEILLRELRFYYDRNHCNYSFRITEDAHYEFHPEGGKHSDLDVMFDNFHKDIVRRKLELIREESK